MFNNRINSDSLIVYKLSTSYNLALLTKVQVMHVAGWVTGLGNALR